MLQVGTTYTSKAGNEVEIYAEINTGVHLGVVRKCIEGHEVLKGKTHRFNAEGRWLAEDGKTVTNCIHDLIDTKAKKKG